MDSFEQLLRVGARRNVRYDRIILENSGVAEPQNIRDQFNEAIALGHPLMSQIHLDSLVTVVDSATFIRDYSSRAPLAARPELGDGGGLRPVVDLLVEQVECADHVILNKADMLDGSTMESLQAIVCSLNPLCTIKCSDHGRINVDEIFGPTAAPGLVARLNTEGHHRGSVAAARASDNAQVEEAHVQQDGHSDDQRHLVHTCDAKHKHNTGDGDADGAKLESACMACSAGKDVSGHGADKDCDGTCEHAHHNHKASRQETSAAARFGIISFVYVRRRPFHPQRLKDLVLRWMPVSYNQALDGTAPAPVESDSPIRTVLRSKGFVWLSHAHTTALYWSHAGQHFELRDEGEWWAAVPDEEWPAIPAQRATILADFDDEGPFGDRRQEIVFIGASMDKDAICTQLDSALLSDEEMKNYVDTWKDERDPEHPPIPAE